MSIQMLINRIGLRRKRRRENPCSGNGGFHCNLKKRIKIRISARLLKRILGILTTKALKRKKLIKKEKEKEKEEAKEEEKTAGFDCNICMDAAKEAVVTCCGHLYCWPCLFRWLQMRANECPVCIGSIDESSIFPIYGGETSGANGREEVEGLIVPPRPQGQRLERFIQPIPALGRRELIVQAVHGFLTMIHTDVCAFFGYE